MKHDKLVGEVAVLDPRFNATAFSSAAAVDALTQELETLLQARLRAAVQPEPEASAIIEELRQLGHDLWSFDASDEMQSWCGDWTAPANGGRLFVDFTYREEAPREVRVTFKRDLGPPSSDVVT
ncbi:hypothetical protein [Corallococcus silvisoli]|uniref:hypothetical protein n=1 Tax=Corallococcus silvisoli TaxID=2697031 RepID=UPI001376529F|nr:hypothetical protein [Corallococcus silvisoli]NBD07932.1 hypothetical protein [Corallococcus silvisoli]